MCRVDTQTRISTQDSDHNEKDKNHKQTHQKYNKKPLSSLTLRLESAFSCIERLKLNNHSFQQSNNPVDVV